MALARVVTFEGVDKARMDEMDREMQGQEQPEGLNATEIIVLHDPEAEKSLVIVFFETEDDYKRATSAERDAGRRHAGAAHVGDEVQRRYPYDSLTPGGRWSLTQYDTATTLDGFIADLDNSLDWLFARARDEDGLLN